jgi:hypothetical protein
MVVTMPCAIKVQHKVKVRRLRKCEYISNFNTVKIPCPNNEKTELVASSTDTFNFYFGGVQFESQTR